MIKTYICLECGLRFESAQRFRDHRASHVIIKPFECGYCKRRFTDRDTMRKHLQKEHISGMEFK